MRGYFFASRKSGESKCWVSPGSSVAKVFTSIRAMPWKAARSAGSNAILASRPEKESLCGSAGSEKSIFTPAGFTVQFVMPPRVKAKRTGRNKRDSVLFISLTSHFIEKLIKRFHLSGTQARNIFQPLLLYLIDLFQQVQSLFRDHHVHRPPVFAAGLSLSPFFKSQF